MTQLEFFAALANGAKWGVPASISRSGSATGGLPIDAYSIFDSKEKAELYASQNKAAVEAAGMVNNAYVGQIITVWESHEIETEEIGEDGQPIKAAVDTVNVYYIDADKTLKPVGIVPTGDGATIEVTADGLIALKGFANAGNGTVAMRDENGNFTWKTLEEIGAGDGNSVTEVTAADKSVSIEDKAEEDFEGHKYEVKVNLSADESNALELKTDGLYVATPAEYAIVKDTIPTEGSQATYHLTKDGTNTDVAIEIPIETNYAIRVETENPEDTALKHYVFYQGDGAEPIAHIDIPKDLVVQSGSVVVATVTDVTESNGVIIGETYIKLVIANQVEPIYIAAKDLIDVYTVANSNKTITMSIVGTEIATEVKISEEVGNSLEAKDDGLYVKVPELPTVIDAVLSRQYVTSVEQNNGRITVHRNTISYNDLEDRPALAPFPEEFMKSPEELAATEESTIAVITELELDPVRQEITPKTVEVASKKGLEDLASIIGVKANDQGQVATGVFADIALINQTLATKVDTSIATAEGGTRFINSTEIAKLAALNLEGNEITISGSVNASQVKELAEYITDFTTGSGYKVVTADIYVGTHPGTNGASLDELNGAITEGKIYELRLNDQSYYAIASGSTGDQRVLLSFKNPETGLEILAIQESAIVGDSFYTGQSMIINEVAPRLAIEKGAQENKIEAIMLPDAELPLAITEKTVALPAFIEGGYGLIKGALLENGKPIVNKLYANAGVGEVKAISTDILVNGEEEFILFGGNSGAAQA